MLTVYAHGMGVIIPELVELLLVCGAIYLLAVV